MSKQSVQKLAERLKGMDHHQDKHKGKNQKHKAADKDPSAKEIAELKSFKDEFENQIKFLHQKNNLKSSLSDEEMSSFYENFLDLLDWLKLKGKRNSKFHEEKQELFGRIEDYQIANDISTSNSNMPGRKRTKKEKKMHREIKLQNMKAEIEHQKRAFANTMKRNIYAHLKGKPKRQEVDEIPKEKIKIELPDMPIESSQNNHKIVEPVEIVQSKKEESSPIQTEQKKKKARVIVVEMLTEDDCLKDSDLKSFIDANNA